MADLDAITTPLTALLAALEVDGERATAVHLWNVDRNATLKRRTWLVTVGEWEIERYTGRYRRAVKFVCVYAVGSKREHLQARRAEAAAMAQAAVEAFNSQAGMVLGDGNLVSLVEPITTAGELDTTDGGWVASMIEVQVTSHIRYSERVGGER